MKIDDLLSDLQLLAKRHASECRRGIPCQACSDAALIGVAIDRLKRYRAENATLKVRVSLLNRDIAAIDDAR